MVFRLVTLGDLRLTDSDGRTMPYPEKALIAICYLLLAKGTERTRTDIAQFLWEDVDPPRASSNLRTLLSRVKSQQAEMGTELLVIRDTSLSVNTSAIESDFAALDAVYSHPTLRLHAFKDTCRGKFLNGADGFSERGRAWIEGRRETILSQFVDALCDVVTPSLADHIELCRDGAFRLLELDPHCEPAYRTLMRAYALSGLLNPARAIFERCRDRLWQDLKAAPEQMTLDLIRHISSIPPQVKPATGSGRADVTAANDTYLPRVALLPPVMASSKSLLPSLLEDVTIGLCTFKTISTVAPHTSARIALEADRSGAYARHRISYVLDTNISARDPNESLFAQLIDVRNDRTVWAERFDAGVAILPRQYHAIARRIAASIAGQIEENELQRLGFEQHPNAYQYYLMGQRFLKRLDLPEIRRARKAFRLAVKQDPGFSAALAGLARTDHMEWLLTARGDAGLLTSCEQHAMHAIRTNSEAAGGYRELGVAKLLRGAFDESIDALERAENASPCHADLIADYADTLIHSSDPVRGLAKIEMAIDLNPLAPDFYHWTAAGANYCLERYDEALACLSRMQDQSHTSRVAAACWGMLGDRKKAHQFKRKTMATHPDFDIETWLSIMPIREQWQKDQYREGLRKAGFS